MTAYIKKNIKKSILPGIILGLLCGVGYFVKRDGALWFGIDRILVLAAAVFIQIVIVTLSFSIADMLKDKRAKNEASDDRVANNEASENALPWINRVVKSSLLYYFIAFVLILILWIPTFLALYPGLFIYDALWQYSMYVQGEVTAHHPILHTYMLGGIIDSVYKSTGSINKAGAAYTIVQMVIMALGYAYILYVFHREKVSTVLHAIALFIWGLFPVCAIFSVAMTKDSIFSVAVADFVVINFLLLRDGKEFFKRKSNCILWVIFALVVMIFRNNAKYALILMIPFVLVRLYKDNKASSDGKKSHVVLKSAIMMLVTGVLFFIYAHPITNAVTIDGISTAEMLSVPAQQIARVYNYHNDELSSEDKDQIEQIFGYSDKLTEYIPQQADNVKGCMGAEYLEKNMGGLIKTWVKFGARYPKEYVDAFLELTYPFWYMWPRYVVYTNGDETYIPMWSSVPIEQNPKVAVLYDYYSQFAKGKIVQGYNWISWIFSPALYFYVFICAAAYSIKENKRKFYPLFLAVLLLWLTYMLGPVAQIRYALYLLCLIPCWGLIIGRSSKRD